MSDYKNTKLWKVLIDKDNIGVESKITDILDKTIPLLKEIKRVFPTYTNHDAEHSLKILKLIEMLIGDKIEKFSISELAVIILSSYWHDLGMMCHDKNEILDEKWFTQKNKELNSDLVSNYLRSYHHLRLEKYLFDTDFILDNDNKHLLIKNNDVVDISYHISMSHNYPTKELEDFTKFSSNGSDDDFVFCALLLRLADIMDFDYERTPISSFNFLGLNNPKNTSEIISQNEWEKHKASLGFEYKNNILYFKAVPSNPEIEFSIREFIKVIENEFEKSKLVFNSYCYEKWGNVLNLPIKIDVSGIKPQGYKFGDYKFSLDNNQVLNLLTGNDIYSNKLIFIRELLQNSIDASMYREALEKNKKNYDFICNPINITDWHDQEDGSYWIRIDDFGIGMNEHVLINYFTKIGKSFYESKDFNTNIDYKAISRFGIGILSCFMVADKVEISTKKEDCEAIRFSIKSLNSYFITQLENEHKFIAFFPSSNPSEKQKYRRDVGTSIAVKIDFNKLNYWFDIKKELARHIFYSPIKIEYNNKKIGTTIDDLKKNPWIDEEKLIELNKKNKQDIANFLGISNYDSQNDVKVSFKISPIKLISKDSKIISQILLIMLNEHYADYKINMMVSSDYFVFKSKLYFDPLEHKFKFIMEKTYEHKRYQHLNGKLIIDLEEYEINFIDKSKIGHNGIYIGEDFSSVFNEDILNFISNDKNHAIAHTYLSNEFRPFLDISRSKEVKFDYKTISTANLMLSKFISQNDLMNRTYDCSLIRNRFNGFISFNEVLNDENLEEWKREKLFRVKESDYISMSEIKNRGVLNYPELRHLHVEYIYKAHTQKMFIQILLILFTNGYLDENGTYYVEDILEESKYQDVEDNAIVKYFPVGFFINYHKNIKDKIQLRTKYNTYSLNIGHPFSKWMISNAEILNNNYKGIFEDIKSKFVGDISPNKNQKLNELLFLLQKINPKIIDLDVIESLKYGVE